MVLTHEIPSVDILSDVNYSGEISVKLPYSIYQGSIEIKAALANRIEKFFEIHKRIVDVVIDNPEMRKVLNIDCIYGHQSDDSLGSRFYSSRVVPISDINRIERNGETFEVWFNGNYLARVPSYVFGKLDDIEINLRAEYDDYIKKAIFVNINYLEKTITRSQETLNILKDIWILID